MNVDPVGKHTTQTCYRQISFFLYFPYWYRYLCISMEKMLYISLSNIQVQRKHFESTAVMPELAQPMYIYQCVGFIPLLFLFLLLLQICLWVYVFVSSCELGIESNYVVIKISSASLSCACEFAINRHIENLNETTDMRRILHVHNMCNDFWWDCWAMCNICVHLYALPRWTCTIFYFSSSLCTLFFSCSFGKCVFCCCYCCRISHVMEKYIHIFTWINTIYL